VLLLSLGIAALACVGRAPARLEDDASRPFRIKSLQLRSAQVHLFLLTEP
jgi:hypothetical protein